MSVKNTEALSPLQRAALVIKEMRNKISSLEKKQNEEIAIISMGCRFPKANNPEAFWQLLINCEEGISEVPTQRWNIDEWYSSDPDVPGKTCTKHAGFLENIDLFDPQFFGISPKEAITMDPQQRILLEVAWETMERAGYTPNTLEGTRVGVFVGVTTTEYGQLIKDTNNADFLNAYYVTGNPINAIAGRLSYVFGLQGPSMAVDTACSSSLVSVHLACQSLRNQECKYALAGGVNLMLSPQIFASLSTGKMLAPDGRCKTFSKDADGYGRGEGCGLVLLKRLSDALADGDDVLAIIKGSATNHGGASSGFTVPNGTAQQQLIEEALVNAKVQPSDVDYIEAHGTGTSLGDPIEIHALGHVMKNRQADSPVTVASVKTNIGHLEAAAGIAGLIKSVLAIQNKTIPAHLHFDEPNPKIEWQSFPMISIPKKSVSWDKQKRIAGISSFGASGTNAHIILENVPQNEIITTSNQDCFLFTLSATKKEILEQLVLKYSEFLLQNQNISIQDVCHTVNNGRQHFKIRMALVVSSINDLQQQLERWLQGADLDIHSKKDDSERRQTLTSIAQKYLEGQEFEQNIFKSDEGKRILLPTYTFQRQSYWVEKTLATTEIATKKNKTVTIATDERKNYIANILANSFIHIAGISPENLDIHANLFELGLDSLMLTQLQQSIKKQFAIDIEMELFISDLSSVDKITHFLDMHLEQEFFPNNSPMETIDNASDIMKIFDIDLSNIAKDDPTIERVMKQQINAMSQLVSQQLEFLKSTKTNKQNQSAASPKKVETTSKSVGVSGLYRKLEDNNDSLLDKKQKKDLELLKERYNQKTQKSKLYAKNTRDRLVHSRSIFYRFEFKELTYLLAVENANGSRFCDIDGNEYIDITMGFGVSLLGHNHPQITKSIVDEISRGVVVGPVSRLAGDVANLICEITNTERVAFFNTGTEAIMVALRLTRTITGKNKIVIFSGSYHGTFDGVLATGWMNGDEPHVFPIAPGTTPNTIADCLILEYGSEKSLEIIEKYADEIAAVLVEPVQSRHPSLQPKKFIQDLRKLTEKCEIAFIFDEIITGFRAHLQGAQKWFGIEADLVTYGKIVGGGMPIGVVCGKAKFLNAIDGGAWKYGDNSRPNSKITMIAGTFNMHPVTMAAAKSSLLYLKEQGEELQENLNRKVAKFCDDLNVWLQEQQVPISLDYFSSLFRFNLPKDTEIFFYHLLERGIFIWEGRNCFLSVAHTDADIAKITNTIKETVLHMLAHNWLTTRQDGIVLRGELPLSEAQRELWFLIRTQPEASLAYNESAQLKIKGSLDANILQQTFDKISMRHEMLRVKSLNSEYQIIEPVPVSALQIHDFSSKSDSEVDQWLEQQAMIAFQLEKEPLWKIFLLKIDNNTHILFLVMHHIIADGWSFSILANEIATIYSNIAQGTSSKIPLSVSYEKYLQWHKKQIPNDKDQQYWNKKFADAFPVLELPYDLPRPLHHNYHGKRHQVVIDGKHLELLKEFSRHQKTTLYMTMLTGFTTWLARTSNQSKFMIMIPMAGQSFMGETHLIGQCTQMIPFIVDLSNEVSFREALTATKQQIMAMQTHHNWKVFAQNLAIPFIPTVVFNMDQQLGLSFADLQIELKSAHPEFVKFDLFLNIVEKEKQLVVDFDYSTELFSERSVTNWSQSYLQLLDSFVKNPSSLLSLSPNTEVVRVQGFKVDPKEIATVLEQNKSISQAIVTVFESDSTENNSKLIAYIESSTCNARELRIWLQSILPHYKIPYYFVIVSKIPQTSNGTADFSVLLSVEKETGKKEYVAPQSEIEKKLAIIWNEILKVEKVGLYDHFFELGGNSLIATQISSRIKEVLSVDIPLYALFDNPVLVNQAKCIETHSKNNFTLPPLEAISRNNTLPLSFAQSRLLFLEKLEGASAVYNLPLAVKLCGKIRLDALEKAFNALLERHEVLRTIFSFVNNIPQQIIRPSAYQKIVVVDISSLPDQEKQQQVKKICSEDALSVFDLEKGPLFRTMLIKCSDQEHIVVANVHHIIGDGWSQGIIFSEISALYNSFCQDKPITLPEQHIQYADFANWQAQWLKGETLDTQINYWRNHLQGAPSFLDLPVDYPRPSLQTFNGDMQSFAFSLSLSQKLKALSESCGTSLFMTIYSAFAILLSKYSGQDDLVIGCPVANRNHKEIEALIGFFVNVLPLRIQIDSQDNFHTLLEKVRKISLDGYAHQDVPFEQLVEALQPERSLAHSPIFQVALVLQNMPNTELELFDLETSTMPLPEKFPAKFDLTLFIEEANDKLTGYFEYNTDLFSAEKITRMCEHLEILLEQVAVFPQKKVVEYIILTAKERQTIAQWNDTGISYPETFIHKIFSAQAQKTPQSIALIENDREYTFAQVDTESNRLASYLQSLDNNSLEIIGIYMERSATTIISMLAVLKLGKTYLPLDPNYPNNRIAFMVKDAQCSLVLTVNKHCEAAQKMGFEATIVNVDASKEIIATHPKDTIDTIGIKQQSDIAYVIYTSGSTGNPKGVLGTHKGTLNRFEWMWTKYPFAKGEICCHKTSLNFVDSIWEIFGCLLQGVPLVIFADETVKDTEKFIEVLAEKQISRIVLVPSLLRAMLQLEKSLSKRLPKLHYWITSGEVIDIGLASQFKKSYPDTQFINLYGSSEVSADSTYYEIQGTEQRSIPIGKPISNTKIWILDRNLQQAPIGISGQICISGDGLAKGYIHQQQLTNDKFIVNPHQKDNKLYQTGDIGRYLENGDIEYLGRADHQVKIRGFRIELGEIESALLEHEKIKQCIVLISENSGIARIVAYIIADGKLDTSQIHFALKKKLPQYMIPKAYIYLDRFPLVPSGKIDCNALPKPKEAHYIHEAYVAPKSDTEKKLTRIWLQILKMNQIGVHDNFFDLGGHSLLAIRVVTQVKEEFAIDLSIRQCFLHPTIFDMGEYIDNLLWITKNEQQDCDRDTGTI